jgi:K+-transporting ATPase ATPase C chain
MWQQIVPGLRMMVVMTVLTGFIYPGVVTGLCQAFFRDKANGSLVTASNGQVIGSRLIAQGFTRPEYLQPRPSAAGNGYDATSSSFSNLGPTSQKLVDRVKTAEAAFRKDNPDFSGPIPADLLTTSASGLDPEVSPASADAQAARIARARGMTIAQVQVVIARHTEGRDFGFMGEPRVNVLETNLDLDKHFPKR